MKILAECLINNINHLIVNYLISISIKKVNINRRYFKVPISNYSHKTSLHANRHDANRKIMHFKFVIIIK